MPNYYPMEFVAVDGQQQLPSTQVHIPGLSEQAYQQLAFDNSSGIQRKVRKVRLSALPPPVNIHLQVPDSNLVKEKTASFLLGDPANRTTLLDEELEYFYLNGQNALLFVHGYNLPYGAYGKHIHAIHYESVTGFKQETAPEHDCGTVCTDQTLFGALGMSQVQLTHQDATTYRSIEILEQEFPGLKRMHANHHSLESLQLNGTGAHNWLVHMEYNINRAAGFEGRDFRRYTRLIGIFWPGYLSSSLDFILAEDLADSMAVSLVPLIKQLHHYPKGPIAINILAHSMGCRLILKLMDILGQSSDLHECIDHVFLWQPSLPDTALSTDPALDTSFRRNNFFPHAHQAVKRLIVLFSQHDNLLGPIPTQEHPSKGLLAQGDDLGGVISIYAIHGIDKQGIPNSLQSAYRIAHLFGIPLSTLLLDSPTRHHYYQLWLQRYPQTMLMGVTLLEQMHSIQQRYPIAFKTISLVMQSYLAVTKHCLLAFLFNPQSLQQINQLRFQLVNDPLLNWSFQTMSFIQDEYRHLENKHQWVHNFCRKLLNPSNHNLLFEWIRDGFLYREFIRFLTPEYQGMTWLRTAGDEIAALILTVVTSKEASPRPAMGYKGPFSTDPTFQKNYVKQGKYHPVDQTKWLFSHSGMKIPSEDLMKSIYIKEIMHMPGMKFGRYPNVG